MNIAKLTALLLATLLLSTQFARPEFWPADAGWSLFSYDPKVLAAKDKAVRDALIISDSKKGAIAAARQADERRQLIRTLLSIVNGTNSVNEKFPAVLVLGMYHSSEAAPILARHLEWENYVTNGDGVVEGYTPLDQMQFPVEFALREIGEPSIPPLLNHIEETDDTKIVEKCVRVCRGIEGADVTQLRLKKLLSSESDRTKRNRVKVAIAAFDKMQAVPNLLEKIAQTNDTELIKRYVLKARKLEHPALTNYLLQLLLDQQTDPEKKVHIQVALEYSKKLDASIPRPKITF